MGKGFLSKPLLHLYDKGLGLCDFCNNFIIRVSLEKGVDRLSPDGQSGPESLLFSQNVCSTRYHLCMDSASGGSDAMDGDRKEKVSAPQDSLAIPAPRGI